ncbi:MAG: branched-chain amino acid ABC transporter permease [Actinomycetes bacterium]
MMRFLAKNGRRWKLVGLVVGIGAAWSVPYVFSNYMVSVASLILISAMLATSVNFMAGNVNLVSVGHAGIAATAGYGLAWSFVQGHSLVTQLLIALALTLVASFIFGLTSMRTSGIFFLMATLALGMVVFGLSYRMSRITGGENGLSGIRRPEMFAPYWKYYFLVLVVFIVVTAAVWVVTRSPFGMALRGIRESENRMESLGYNVAAYKLGAMMISGIVAGISGVFAVWQMEFVSPANAGFLRSALATLMVILGGVGTFLGPLTGATIVSWIEHVLSTYIERWPTVLGLIFIAVIVFAPNGIGGAVKSWWEKRQRSARSRRPVGATATETLASAKDPEGV